MNILGIETSCDETAAAVVKNGRDILSNCIASSLKQHKKYGGVIPEIASRHHLELIHFVVNRALHDANLKLKDIGAVAVTQKPGLIGSLLVGVSYARALAFAIQKPLREVDHIQAHLYANFLTSSPPRLPAIGLVVSGGHSSIFHVKTFTDMTPLGETRDDAAGEAFDKVARILRLGYPGGPIIDRLAKRGQNRDVRFASAALPDSFDFSFSGTKTAVLYHVRQQKQLTKPAIRKIAYAFQDSVTSILTTKCIQACQKKRITTLLIGGGVAANSALREKLTQEAKRRHIRVSFPPMSLCLDNAAMIAGLGYHLKNRRKTYGHTG